MSSYWLDKNSRLQDTSSVVRDKVWTRTTVDWQRWRRMSNGQSRLDRNNWERQPNSQDWSGPAAAMLSGRHQRWCSGQHASVQTTLSPWRWRHRAGNVLETSQGDRTRDLCIITPCLSTIIAWLASVFYHSQLYLNANKTVHELVL